MLQNQVAGNTNANTAVVEGCKEAVQLKDWSLDVSQFEKDALTVMKHVRPEWNPESVAFRMFTDGITNKLVGCYLKGGDRNDMVLVRVNGEGTELIIDRQAEIRTFQLLYAANCGPPLHAVFKNGMAYGFFPGKPVDVKSVRDNTVASLIAKEMVRLHSVDPDNGQICPTKRRSAFPAKVQRFLDLGPDAFSQEDKQSRFVKEVPVRSALQKELTEICTKLEELKMPVVFSHNDLLLNNIIYDEEKKAIHFIDYEYASLNYQAYDIGDHFCEYAGIDEVDYNLYPDLDYQKTWLRCYLRCDFEAKGRSPDDVTDLDIERLCVQTNICACASHFFWGIWALIQAKNSSIDFDFLGYAITRLNEYFSLKKKFFYAPLP